MQSALQSLESLDFAYATAPNGPALNAFEDYGAKTTAVPHINYLNKYTTSNVSFDELLESMDIVQHTPKYIDKIVPLNACDMFDDNTLVVRVRTFLSEVWETIFQHYKLYDNSLIHIVVESMTNGIYNDNVIKRGRFDRKIMLDLLQFVYPEMVKIQSDMLHQNDNLLNQQLVTLGQTYLTQVQAALDTMYQNVMTYINTTIENTTLDVFDTYSYVTQLEAELKALITAQNLIFKNAVNAKVAEQTREDTIVYADIDNYNFEGIMTRAKIVECIQYIQETNVTLSNQLDALKQRLTNTETTCVSHETIIDKTNVAVQRIQLSNRYVVETFSIGDDKMFDRDHLQVQFPEMQTTAFFELGQLVKVYIRYHYKVLLNNTGDGTGIISLHVNNPSSQAIYTYDFTFLDNSDGDDIIITDVYYEMPVDGQLTLFMKISCNFPNVIGDDWTCTLTAVSNEHTCLVLGL
ncbi:hypothetical protein ECIV_ORF65 [European chub iridovirus]|nr:hypothetical protein ECIV_ORF65 [European chub iridovirus]